MEDKLEAFLGVIEELNLTELNLLSQIVHVLTEKKLNQEVMKHDLNKTENQN